MFLIISRWLKDKKSQDAKVRKFLMKLKEKCIILLLWEILRKAALLEELINLEDIKLEENVSHNL